MSKDGESNFRITDGKGFHITFASGYTVSVQFGGGNYSDNYDMDISREGYRDAGKRGSGTAEVAIFNRAGMVDLPCGDTVDGYLSANKVLNYINAAATDDPRAYLDALAEREKGKP